MSVTLQTPKERITIPQTAKTLFLDEGPKKGFLETIWAYLASLFSPKPKRSLLDRISVLPQEANLDTFTQYVANIRSELDGANSSLNSKEILRMLSVSSVMITHAKKWMEGHPNHDYSEVEEIFKEKERIRSRGLPSSHYEVPDALRSLESRKSPGMKNQGNTCYLASLLQGLLGDPLTRSYFNDWHFDEEHFNRLVTSHQRRPDEISALKKFSETFKKWKTKFLDAQKSQDMTPLSFLNDFRSALAPLMPYPIELRRNQEEDPCEILQFIASILNEKKSSLVKQKNAKRFLEVTEEEAETLRTGKMALEELLRVLPNLERGIDEEEKRTLRESLLTLKLFKPEELQSPEFEEIDHLLKQAAIRWLVESNESVERKSAAEIDVANNSIAENKAQRILALEEKRKTKLEAHQKKREEFQAANRASLASLLLERVTDELTEFPTEAESGVFYTSVSRPKSFCEVIHLASNPRSSAFESFLDHAFHEEGDLYTRKFENTGIFLSLKFNDTLHLYETAPDVMCTCISRTLQSREDATRRTKDGRKIYYKDMSFYLSNRFTEDNKGGRYKMRWFVQHRGSSSDHGHYVHYRLIDDKWYLFNDERVAEVSNKEAQNALETCCLFFAERDKDAVPTPDEIEAEIATREQNAKTQEIDEALSNIASSSRSGTSLIERLMSYERLFSNAASRPDITSDKLDKILREMKTFDPHLSLFLAMVAKGHQIEETELAKSLGKIFTIDREKSSSYLLDSQTSGENLPILTQYVRVIQRKFWAPTLLQQARTRETPKGQIDEKTSEQRFSECLEQMNQVKILKEAYKLIERVKPSNKDDFYCLLHTVLSQELSLEWVPDEEKSLEVLYRDFEKMVRDKTEILNEIASRFLQEFQELVQGASTISL